MNAFPVAIASAWPVFLQGLALSFGLIVAIGAQNAFVLRQGLRREHVGSVVLFCSVADAVLIAAGVFGMAHALDDRPQMARALALAGALFLCWHGWRALSRVRYAGRPPKHHAIPGCKSAWRGPCFVVYASLKIDTACTSCCACDFRLSAAAALCSTSAAFCWVA